MPKKKRAPGRASGKPTSVRVGNVSDVSGNVNIAGGNIRTQHTTTGLSAGEIKQLFDGLYAAIETHAKASPADKEDLKAEVKEIQATVTEAAQKNESVDEGFLSRRFRNIARMAPDLLEVIVATLANPLAGLGVAARKIAEKAKAEAKGA
jgi:cell division septum initiation protein DivIVA